MTNFLLYLAIGCAFGLLLGFVSGFRSLVLRSLSDRIDD